MWITNGGRGENPGHMTFLEKADRQTDRQTETEREIYRPTNVQIGGKTEKYKPTDRLKNQ